MKNKKQTIEYLQQTLSGIIAWFSTTLFSRHYKWAKRVQ